MKIIGSTLKQSTLIIKNMEDHLKEVFITLIISETNFYTTQWALSLNIIGNIGAKCLTFENILNLNQYLIIKILLNSSCEIFPSLF